MKIEEQHTHARTGLRPNCLSFPEVLAQSIALIAPTMTAALLIPLAFASAGQGTWLAYLFGTIMLLFVVFNLNQFARRSTSPGSMYAYTGRGLGARFGVLSGWTLIWAYLFIGMAGMTGFAIFADQLLGFIGISVPPVVFFLISGVVCWFLAYRDIKLSAMLMLILEGLSVTLIICLAIVVLARHGFAIDIGQVSLKGISFSGIGLGVIAAIFSLVGFESATALGEEAKNPLRSIPRAVIWSLILTGLFFVFIAYVEVFGLRGNTPSLDQLTAPLNVLADQVGIGFLKVPLSIGAMLTFFSLSLSCLNAGARIIYPMGRHGVLHTAIGSAHPLHKTPHVAVTVTIVLMVLVPMILTLAGMATQDAYNDVGTFGAIGFLTSYFLISIAAPVYLYHDGNLKAGNVVISLLAILCLLYPAVSLFYPVPAYPVNLFPYIFLVYMAVGGGWLFVVSRRSPDKIEEIERDLESTHRLFSQETLQEPVLINEMVPELD
ncbi:MAG TPA: APC family permease [Ktedonobacteraceae bacterium]|jgi:amino acid transporter|nr:APC family permease [Ktedonobacteraceae bacterium]